jgi:photosystem II stability/assembly factor-like uncharacterized protein
MRPAFILLALLAGTASAAEPRHFEDATLRAVQLVDEREGWACGDEGVLWHTIDAGKTWERVPSGVRASLRGLYFLDAYVGWVVGREELPSGGSAGVVLYTNDGGAKWRRLMAGSLPALHAVHFTDPKNGILAGDGSEQYPSGVFITTDGGRTWGPAPGPRATSWRAASGSALAGAWNRLAKLREGRLSAVDMDTLGGRTLSGLATQGSDGVAVGQGGLVLLSKGSAGASWHFAETKLPREVLASFDLHAVSFRGKRIRAVGRPGSAVLASDDGGSTWSLQHTGQPIPLHGVYFHDASLGWAVGELGTVLHTRDGGKTWAVQQRGGQRLAALCAHGRPERCLPDVASALGLAEGYLLGAVSVGCPEPATASLGRCGEGCRFEEAFRQAGGASAFQMWQLPVASHLGRAGRAGLLAAWDKLHEDQAARHLLGQLVLTLRTYQPEVALTGEPCDELEEVVAEALREAVKQAGDDKAFPHHLTALGLKPWKPKKLYALARSGSVVMDLTTPSPRLGTTPAEHASAAALLTGAASASTRSFKLLESSLPGAEGHQSLMQGVLLAPGGLARRPLPPIEDLSPAAVKAVRSRARLWAMAESRTLPMIKPEQLVSHLTETLRDMPDDAAARVAHGLGRLYAGRGQWVLARESFALLADRYPSHPLTADALRWLVLHQSSGEVRRRYQMGQMIVAGDDGFSESGKEKPRVKGLKLPEVPKFELESFRAVAHLGGQDDARRWLEAAVQMESKLAAFGPVHLSEPALGLALASARRQLGKTEEARKWLRQFASRQAEGPWKASALTELWLAERTGTCPRPMIVANLTEKRPYLDGKLDDACWTAATPVAMKDASGATASDHRTEVRMSYDRDYVYLAVECRHPEVSEAAPAGKRTRDDDLRGQDRVSLLLDVDRDHATCYHLQADSRGCIRDECWGDASWDPRWYAAVHRSKTGWALEAAIPRAALTDDAILPGQAWALNVLRVLPGKGVQAVSLPAEAPEAALRLEGMGVLMFRLDPRASAERK